MVSGLVALAYLVFIMGTLSVYSRRYYGNKRRQMQDTLAFYPRSPARDIYQSLEDKGVPAKLERAALLAWAAEDVARILKLRECQAPLNSLGEKGLVGDDLFERYKGTEKLLAEEVPVIAQRAQVLYPGYGNTIIASAQEVALNRALRRRVEELNFFRDEFREWMSEANPGEDAERATTAAGQRATEARMAHFAKTQKGTAT